MTTVLKDRPRRKRLLQPSEPAWRHETRRGRLIDDASIRPGSRVPLRIPLIRVARVGGQSTRGKLVVGTLVLPCALGKAGIARRKREGDGKTPAGSFRLVCAYRRADRWPALRLLLPWRATRPDDGWCDDPGAGAYNRPVRRPSRAGHEEMWRADRLYDLVFVLNHNFEHPAKGRGSAIFLHVASEDWAPTAGCIALRPADLRRLAPRLSPRSRVLVRP